MGVRCDFFVDRASVRVLIFGWAFELIGLNWWQFLVDLVVAF